MLLFFLYSSDSRSLFFSAVPLQEMTPLPQELSDQEQLQFIAEWKKQHQKKGRLLKNVLLSCQLLFYHSYE